MAKSFVFVYWASNDKAGLQNSRTPAQPSLCSTRRSSGTSRAGAVSLTNRHAEIEHESLSGKNFLPCPLFITPQQHHLRCCIYSTSQISSSRVQNLRV